LHPLLAAGAANLAAAGIPDRMRQALSDAGYASEDNFTAPCDAELYIAVTRESPSATCSRPSAAAPAANASPPPGPSWQPHSRPPRPGETYRRSPQNPR
jgi:hypothetical protein